MNTKQKYKQLQKELAILLKSFGYKKVKSFWCIDYIDARVIVYCIKELNGDSILWKMKGLIYFKVIDQIFRDGEVLEEFDLASADESVDFNWSELTRSQTPWLVEENTDIDTHFMEVQPAILSSLDELKVRATIENCLSEERLNMLANFSSGTLIRMMTLAKSTEQHSILKQILTTLDKAHDRNSVFVTYHLSLLEQKVQSGKP